VAIAMSFFLFLNTLWAFTARLALASDNLTIFKELYDKWQS